MGGVADRGTATRRRECADTRNDDDFATASSICAEPDRRKNVRALVLLAPAASWIGLVRRFRQQFAASERIQTEDVERAPHLLALREKQSSRGSGSTGTLMLASSCLVLWGLRG
jgi:hypothetical protein